MKTIVDPLLAVTPEGPHLFSLQSGQDLVNENFIPVSFIRTAKWRRRLRYLTAWLPYLPFDPYSIRVPATKRVSTSVLRINHYATRSKQDLRSKYKDRDTMRDWDRRSYSRYHDRNEVDDPVLAPKAPRLRVIIARVQAGARSRAMNG